MLPTPRREEIDHRTIKLLVGLIALSLASLTSFLAGGTITSISAAYYEGGWSQSIFVGFLFAIAAFLLAYNGMSVHEMVLSKVAAAAALGTALFPCKCGNREQIIPYVHAISAATMFVVLGYFCFIFYQRARQKGYAQANARATIYALCGIAIVLSIVVVLFDGLTGGTLSAKVPRIIFYAERTALMAFGISWLTASRVLPMLTREDERFSPFGNQAASN
jgi:hypothetical protein